LLDSYLPIVIVRFSCIIKLAPWIFFGFRATHFASRPAVSSPCPDLSSLLVLLELQVLQNTKGALRHHGAAITVLFYTAGQP